MLRQLFTRLSTISCLAAVAVLAGCGDDPAAPTTAAAPDALIAGMSLSHFVPMLRRAAPLPHDVTVSAVVDRKGGTISLPDAGLTVVVPANAVVKPLTITVTALSGPFASYEFGPHGTTFRQPLRVRQELASLGLHSGDLSAGPMPALAYYSDASRLDQINGVVDAAELWPGTLELGVDDARLSFLVVHFSGYTVSNGISKAP